MPEPSKKKSIEDVALFASKVAEHQGWKVCKDEELFNMLVDGLRTNYNRYGYFSCPCRLASGDKANDKDITCPCEYAKPDIAEYGHCYCGLYLSPEFFETGKNPKPIAERRPEEKDYF
ncbi:MAG: ferredoxin-thioredoxin reductase catalytic domain-containing protein [Promethearchaeota archaeon]